jgi:uncharacterized protein (TIGR02453 family)
MLEKSLSFLSLLKENNYKEWYHENKPLYETAKEEFELFVKHLIGLVGQFDKSLGILEPKDCIFRIFRDIRFSKDKTPYKTNFGAFIARGGRKGENGGYYFHLEPGNSLLAGGIWMPQPDLLKAIRTEIYNNIDEFITIISSKDFKKYFGSIDSDYVLKTAPKDYPKDWPYIDLLKHKSYTVSTLFTDAILTGPSLPEYTIEVFKAMYPFNSYLNNVVLELR